LNNGTRYAPQYIEGRLRFSPYIKDAMSLGEKRDFITVIVIIDFENVGKWAEANHINYTTFADLSQKKETAGLIAKDIQRVNEGFPDETKVKRFALLHKEFDPDEDELTRTRKIRRGFMEERYGNLVAALYSGQAGVDVESIVKYQDGGGNNEDSHHDLGSKGGKGMITFIQLLITGISVGLIYGLIAVGFVLIYKSSQIFNFAQGEMVMVGAFLMWTFLSPLGLHPALGIIIVLIIAGLTGFGLERFPLRPMIGQPILATIMVTMGIAIFLKGLALLLWSSYIGIKYPQIMPEKMYYFIGIPISNITLFS
jgi:hypothetical protein